jgi:SulP family sulfate permease
MAVEAAETALLRRRTDPPAGDLLALEALMGLGLPAPAAGDCLGYLRELELPAGQVLIRAGDRSGDAWLVLAGVLDVTLPLAPAGAAADAPRTRLTTLTPGVLAGELALLSDQPRSADVVARTAARCLLIEATAMARLRVERPDLAYLMLKAVAMQVQQKLRLASTTIASLEA